MLHYSQTVISNVQLPPHILRLQNCFVHLLIFDQISGGTFFARIMRDSEYVTMVDPFTQKYGKWGALQVRINQSVSFILTIGQSQALPAAVSEIFWSASILGALGSTLQVILNIDEKISIIMSAVIALGYTLLGGLISVAYTDVIQIFFIVFGLVSDLLFLIFSSWRKKYNCQAPRAKC